MKEICNLLSHRSEPVIQPATQADARELSRLYVAYRIFYGEAS